MVASGASASISQGKRENFKQETSEWEQMLRDAAVQEERLQKDVQAKVECVCKGRGSFANQSGGQRNLTKFDPGGCSSEKIETEINEETGLPEHVHALFIQTFEQSDFPVKLADGLK